MHSCTGYSADVTCFYGACTCISICRYNGTRYPTQGDRICVQRHRQVLLTRNYSTYQSDKYFVQTHDHCRCIICLRPPISTTGRPRLPPEAAATAAAAARPSYGSGHRKPRKRRASTGTSSVKGTHIPSHALTSLGATARRLSALQKSGAMHPPLISFFHRHGF